MEIEVYKIDFVARKKGKSKENLWNEQQKETNWDFW